MFVTICAIAVSCNDDRRPDTHGPVEIDDDCVYFTKSGIIAAKDTAATFRFCNVFPDKNWSILLSDGAYCGYVSDKGWYYPCKVDDAGNALDASGQIIPFDAPDWFERTENSSKYGLRMRTYGSYSEYNLIMCSPALRMVHYHLPDDPPSSNYHWAFVLNNEDEVYINDPYQVSSFTCTSINGNYVYDLPAKMVLKDRRAKVTVKVACGKLSHALLNGVHFKNVMTQVHYVPTSQTYDLPVMDHGESNPWAAYTANSYPADGQDMTGSGNMLKVPDGDDDIALTKRSSTDEPFVEWNHGTNSGTAVTAIKSFPVYALDYSELSGDRLLYDDIVPEIVVYSGSEGRLKSTVRLIADLEPMKNYLVVVYLSTAVVSAELYISEWNTDPGTTDIVFGDCVHLPVESGWITDWESTDIPEDQSTITD